MRIVEIEWQPRKQVLSDPSTWEYSLGELPDSVLARACFYCIYGRHPVYGADVLLYIGKTTKTEGKPKDVSKRMKEHFKGRFWSHTDLTVTIGVPTSPRL